MAQAQVPIIPLFINGQKIVPSNASTFEVRNLNPSGQVISHAVSASTEDAKAAIESAQTAFHPWRTLPPAAKEAIFRRAIAVTSTPELRTKIAETAHQETAVAKQWANLLNHYVDTIFSMACETVYALRGQVLPSNTGALASIVQPVPLGVIFVISPWNAPVTLSLMTCIPAIAAGNTVVLKTSELSPESQLICADILKEAGLPDGVFNIIHTSREDSPARVAEIIAHPYVRKIGFTGSDRVGKIIAASAAKYLKPCVLELGGKAPAIVLNDANLDAAARGIVSGAFVHSGQVCIGTERVIVQREASQQFIEKVKAIAVRTRAADQSKDPKAQLGYVFNVASAENIIGMIKEAIDAGAELLHGDLKHEGALVQPHVVLGAKPGTRLWDRESFGPVMTMTIVDTIDEAIDLANQSTYSLTSSIWTESYDLAFTLSPRIRAGKVIINSTTIMSESRFHETAFGGSSGYGSFSAEEFVVRQLLSIHKPEGQKFIVSDF